jgi:hypothetical protein
MTKGVMIYDSQVRQSEDQRVGTRLFALIRCSLVTVTPPPRHLPMFRSCPRARPQVPAAPRWRLPVSWSWCWSRGLRTGAIAGGQRICPSSLIGINVCCGPRLNDRLVPQDVGNGGASSCRSARKHRGAVFRDGVSGAMMRPITGLCSSRCLEFLPMRATGSRTVSARRFPVRNVRRSSRHLLPA